MIPLETVQEWINDTTACADAALTPARSLFDASPARQVALELDAALRESGDLYREAVDIRARIEAEKDIRPDVLRQRRREFIDDYSERAAQLDQRVKKLAETAKEKLRAEALPVSTDPAAVLAARQEVELALRLAASAGDKHRTLERLAGRGGEISAVVASEWGRLMTQDTTGDDAFHERVRTVAISTALEGNDEPRKRAAATLKAFETPRPGGGTTSSLYEAVVKSMMVAKQGREVIAEAVIQ